MQPHLIKLPFSGDQSFTVTDYRYEQFPGIWHYHPEVEITWIREGHGTRFIGDHIEQFDPGDLILIGSNVPHTWKSTPESTNSDALVLHFSLNCLGERFWELPENKPLKDLLQRAQSGLRIAGKRADETKATLLLLQKTTGPERILHFLQLLISLAKSKELTPLSSDNFLQNFTAHNSERINKAYEYVMHNFTTEASLQEAARLVSMSPAAFSRYFKAHTRQSFTDFVIELKVRYAGKLLQRREQTVSGACYEAGFNNISNFNKQFKRFLKVSPKQYQLAQLKKSGS